MNISNVTHIMVSQLVCSGRYSHTSSLDQTTHSSSRRLRVQRGPKGAPAAVRTRRGWARQGPTSLVESSNPTHAYPRRISTPIRSSKPGRDTLPFPNEKSITRSKQDKEAIARLDTKTMRVHIDGTDRYATPLLRVKGAPVLNAPIYLSCPFSADQNVSWRKTLY